MNCELASVDRIRRFISNPYVLIVLGLFCFTFHIIIGNTVDPHASMDAAYYHIISKRVAAGEGFTEPFIWQHLKQYNEIVRPIDYWQPLGVLLYSIINFIKIPNSEVYLNYILWTIVVLLVFYKTLSENSIIAAFISYFFVFTAGKFCFYISTTDTVAVYGLLGFILLELISSSASVFHLKYLLTGVVAGLMALTRIEGVFFLLLAAAINWRRSSISAGILTICSGFLTMLPWLVRNKIVLGSLWVSNWQAIFLKTYDDMFDPNAQLNFLAYFSQGFSWIITQKLKALTNGFIEMFAIPTMLVFFPLLVIGILKEWKSQGKIFAGLVGFFWFINGVVFTCQSIYGTILHNTAAFFPHFAYYVGIGFNKLFSRNSFKNKFFGIIAICWMFLFTISGIRYSSAAYEFENAPYREIFKKHNVFPPSRVASHYPIRVYYLTGCEGVRVPSTSIASAIELANKFKCQYLLVDYRAISTNSICLPVDSEFCEVATAPFLTLLGKLH